MSGRLLDWILENEDCFRKPRLPSLYSDLALQRQTNPAGYAFNVSAWQAALAHAALSGQVNSNNPATSSSSPSSASSPSTLTIRTSDSLLTSLSSQQYGRPLGLGAVISESVAGGKMVPLSDFLAAESSIDPTNCRNNSWVPSPLAVLKWGLKSLGLGGRRQDWDVDGRLRAGELVVVENLEKVAPEVVKRQNEEFGQGLTERLWARDAFARQLAVVRPEGDNTGEGRVLGERDVEVLLKFLQREKQAISYDDKVVKFKAPSALHPEPITHQDTTVASLKTLISTLTSQCANLSTRISTLTMNASSAVKSSNRISALSALRSKRLAQRTLQQRTDTLAQLEELYAKIEQAAGQVEMIKVMEDSAVVLRGLNEQVGGADKVEDVIEELKGEMEKVDEVGQVIQQPLGGAVGEPVDEGEIDEELAAMEREEREGEVKKEAEATRRRLEEARKREDLEQAEKRARIKELEQRVMTLREGQSTPQDTTSQQVDAGPRGSQASAGEDTAIANPDTTTSRAPEGRKAVAESGP